MSQPAGTDHTSGDGTLARAAASGDVAARDALLARHGGPAWRLARVLCPARAAAVAGQGIATAIARVGGDGDLADAVLSGVHRSALATSRHAGTHHDAGAADAPSDPDVAALLSLPERWRVALCLNTDRHADAAGVATVLGVSATAAAHMVERATQTVRLRGGDPDRLAGAVDAWVGPQPTELGGAVGAALTAARVRTRPLLSTVAGGRLGERTQRSMAIVAGGVIAVGVVGIGVLGQGFGANGSSSVANQYGPGATGTILATPASRSVTAPATRTATASTGTRSGTVTAASGGRTGGGTTTGSGPHRTTGTGGHAGSGTTSGGSTANTGGTTNGGGTTTGATTSSSASNGSGSNTAPTVAVTTPTTPVTTAPTTSTTLHVTVGGVASVGSGGGTTSITVGSSSNPVASATTCENGVEINALGVAVGSCPTSGTPTTTTTTPSVLGGLGL